MYTHMCILESACALRAHLILLFAGTFPSNISLTVVTGEAFRRSTCVCEYNLRVASFGAK